MAQLKSHSFILLFAFGQLLLVGWLDYITGYEISLAVFYFIPIAYAAWHLGRGWSMFFGLLSAFSMSWVEFATGFRYSHNWMMGEKALMRVCVFGFVAFSFNYFKRTIEQERQKVRRLEAMLTLCNGCGKVRDDQGNWMPLGVYLRENTEVQSQMKLCPTCAREAYAAAGGRKPEDGGRANQLSGETVDGVANFGGRKSDIGGQTSGTVEQ